MKNIRAMLICLVLVLTCVLTFVACDGGESGGEGTKAPVNTPTNAPTEEVTEAPTEEVTEAPTEETTDAPVETPTEDGEENTDNTLGGDDEYDPAYYVVIRTAEDLMAFNKAVNEDGEVFFDMTVVFLDDIDLTGYTWQPLDGYCLGGTTFDGNGHTISNMYINYNEACETIPEDQIGAGFVGVALDALYFEDITFDNCTIDANERHVGCLVGKSWNGASCDFTNVKVTNFTVNGWMDYNNTDPANGGRPIAFRVAGIMGAAWGPATFYQCTVENIKLSGFHNLAGILGYDATGMVDEYSFEECVVNNAEMTFSYCLAASYTVDMPRKFVSVFYNAANWGDNIDFCVETGNTYSSISFFDWSAENAEYTPAEFRSWTREEAAAGA